MGPFTHSKSKEYSKEIKLMYDHFETDQSNKTTISNLSTKSSATQKKARPHMGMKQRPANLI